MAAEVNETEKKLLTPIKAIRKKCLQCSADQVKEVRLCPVKKCALYPYRMGHRPKIDEKMGDNTNKNDGVNANGSRY